MDLNNIELKRIQMLGWKSPDCLVRNSLQLSWFLLFESDHSMTLGLVPMSPQAERAQKRTLLGKATRDGTNQQRQRRVHFVGLPTHSRTPSHVPSSTRPMGIVVWKKKQGRILKAPTVIKPQNNTDN